MWCEQLRAHAGLALRDRGHRAAPSLGAKVRRVRSLSADCAGCAALPRLLLRHVFNLLGKGDLVTATTFRKVQQTSSTGSSTAQKVKIRLTIEIETIEFDTQTCELRIKGKNMEVN